MHTGIDFNVYQTDINAMERAIKERLFYVVGAEGGFVAPPEPLPNAFSRGLNVVYEYFKREAQYVSPLTKEQFLGAYDGRRRAAYERAFDTLQSKPLEVKDSFISYFVKVEKTNFTKKQNPVPRGISPRSPRYHVTLGPYIKRIEHTVYDIIASLFDGPTVMKGYNMVNRGQVIKDHWNSFVKPVAIGLDASRFDQHVSLAALEWEHSIYKLFYPGNFEFSKLLKWQTTNKGFGYCHDGSAKFTLLRGRMSGDMNTALGNCLLMCSMVYAYCKDMNFSKFKLVNDGDDCVLFIEQDEFSKTEGLTEWFFDYGFNMVREQEVTILEHIEFCQAHPVRVSETETVMIRHNPISFSKDAISIIPIDRPHMAKMWLRAIGECGLALNSGIPVAQSWYLRLLEEAGDVKALVHPALETGMSRLAKGMQSKSRVPTALARFSYYLAFGIEPDKQKIYETTICNQSIGFEVVDAARIGMPLYLN